MWNFIRIIVEIRRTPKTNSEPETQQRFSVKNQPGQAHRINNSRIIFPMQDFPKPKYPNFLRRDAIRDVRRKKDNSGEIQFYRTG